MQFLEPVLGGIAAFLLGVLWYTVLFGKQWQAETGLSDDEAKKGVVLTHGISLLMMIILSYGVNQIIGYHGVEYQTLAHGAFHGGLAALMYGVPAVAINYLYQKKSIKLFLMDAGYLVCFLALSGAVMAALHLG
ncbi:DUF1761 domain-containing protein [Bacteroidia bacterium]|nr:DUF1761 domain-containing protein [Bacteroidia bacterium]MDB4107238.1 DUF1761 domain-containing protein [Bacteroidia bacterium]MDB9883153.1 DUF1761 domain-containing protein [Bacteroidia bacterium]